MSILQLPVHTLHMVPAPVASAHVPVSISMLAVHERTQLAPHFRYWSSSISAPRGTLGHMLLVLIQASMVVLPAGAWLPNELSVPKPGFVDRVADAPMIIHMSVERTQVPSMCWCICSGKIQRKRNSSWGFTNASL